MWKIQGDVDCIERVNERRKFRRLSATTKDMLAVAKVGHGALFGGDEGCLVVTTWLG